MRRATALWLLVLLVLCGVGLRPFERSCPSEVRCRCCAAAEGPDGAHEALRRGAMACCEALPDAIAAVSPAVPPSHDEDPVLAADAIAIAGVPWGSSSVQATTHYQGPDATGPPLYRRHCRLVL